MEAEGLLPFLQESVLHSILSHMNAAHILNPVFLKLCCTILRNIGIHPPTYMAQQPRNNDFYLHLRENHTSRNMYLVSSVFTSIRTPLYLIELLYFSLWYLFLRLGNYQHRPEADVSHSVSFPL